MLFHDRLDAGRRLGAQLEGYADRSDVLVLALPRGGVPVAFEVARRLRAPLDVFVVRKLGVPGRKELAMGAIASGGVRVLNTNVVEALRLPETAIDATTEVEVVGLSPREGESLISELRAHIANERFRYTHRWAVGDIVYWDNQAVLHARSAFDPSARRVLKRVSLAGSRPF